MYIIQDVLSELLLTHSQTTTERKSANVEKTNRKNAKNYLQCHCVKTENIISSENFFGSVFVIFFGLFYGYCFNMQITCTKYTELEHSLVAKNIVRLVKYLKYIERLDRRISILHLDGWCHFEIDNTDTDITRINS